jgi:hypothetical protein
MWESLTHSSLKAARSLLVRSALNPMLWLTAIFSPVCFVAASAFRADQLISHVLIIAGLIPPAVTCLGFFYFMFTDPGKLQSEGYQLQHEALQMIQQRRTGELTIDPTSLPATTNPALPAPSQDASNQGESAQ